jgi:hypothetical protein
MLTGEGEGAESFDGGEINESGLRSIERSINLIPDQIE